MVEHIMDMYYITLHIKENISLYLVVRFKRVISLNKVLSIVTT